MAYRRTAHRIKRARDPRPPGAPSVRRERVPRPPGSLPRFVPPYSDLSQVPPDLVDRAVTEKLPWIRQYIEEGYPRGRLLEYAKQRALKEGLPLSEVPPYRTLRDWADHVRDHNLLGLIDRVRRDAGSHRLLTPDQLSTMEIAMFGGRLGHAKTESFLKEHHPDEARPQYHGIRKAANEIVAGNLHLAELAKKGPAWWRNLYRLAVSMGFLPGGYRLAIDSTVVNVWARIRDWSGPPWWRPIRPALTVIEDVGSRLMTAFNVSLVAVDSGIVKGTFLRACNQEAQNMVHPGLISTGVPRQVVYDRGSEHRGEFGRLMMTMLIDVLTAGSAEANGRIEALHETMEKELFSGMIGYSKTSKPFDPYASPDADERRGVQQLQYEPYRLEIPLMALPTVDELEQKILIWGVDRTYAAHSALPLDNPELIRMIDKALAADSDLSFPPEDA